MKTLRSVKGMHDILPVDMPRWHFVEATYRNLVERFGFSEIRTPILEPLDLFVRGIGETTDIVEKEMYAFTDKGGEHLGLRPEGTASAIRAFIQHNVGATEPRTKWYYLGPMFRRERPAKGRYRQFFQAGAEVIGVGEPAVDAEIIDMAVAFIVSLGIEDVVVKLNTLGDSETRPAYRSALKAYLEAYKEDLCTDCLRRLETNPLRVLDCKIPACGEIAAKAPSVHDFLSRDARAHFEDLCALLDHCKTPYDVAPQMVRGLDYYSRTIFEIHVNSHSLGAQSAVLGGGRYDGLVKQLGGRDTPAIGFSFGIERLLMMLPQGTAIDAAPLFFVAGVGDGGLTRALDIARQLREQGTRAEISFAGGSLRSQLKRAHRLGAQVTIIAGEEEFDRGAVAWRNMEDGMQEEILLGDLMARVEANQ
ncbi:MAG: histidine--tRNA ligase [Myxococcota bacterium]|nr:histidine--tRNA ligase [Myxococcota bacterium]